MEATEQEPTRTEILAAATRLAEFCNGAAALDHSGFNAVDSPSVKSILGMAEPTHRQVRSLWNILRKYRGQLDSLGIDYAELVPPSPGMRDDTGRFMSKLPRVRLEWVDTRGGRKIAIIFAYNPEVVEAVKKIEGRSWNSKLKKWLIPDDVDYLDKTIAALGAVEPKLEVDVAEEVTAAVAEERERRKNATTMSRAATADLEVPTRIPLLPYQRAGVQWFNDLNGRALCGDEMGLGKTAEALGYLALHPEALPALVICPANVRVTWYREILKFTDLKPLIVTSKTSLPAVKKLGVDVALEPQAGYDVTIVNYDLLETQTPAMWVRALLKDDKSVIPSLIEAGQYAMGPLNKGLQKATLWSKPHIERAMKEIGKLGDKANRKKFVKVFVNGARLPDFMKLGFKTLIGDESHYLKKDTSQRTMAAMEISKMVQHALLLTGTPLLNRPREIWSQVHIVNPSIFPPFFDFGRKFCAGHKGKFGWDFSGASNLEELDHILRSRVMIRRLKSQVLTELPPKTRVTIPIVLADRSNKRYHKAAKPAIAKLLKLKRERDEWRKKIDSMDEAARKKFLADHAELVSKKAGLTGFMVKEIEEIKQAAVRAKFDECVRFVLDAQEQAGKVIVFATHHEAIDKMVEKLQKEKLKVAAIDGRVPQAKRVEIIDDFQEGDLEVLVLGLHAASEGLTLTACHTEVIIEFAWNPGRHQQAEDRIHRIGQTVPSTIYYLVGLGTIEEKIAGLIDSKREVVNAALGEGDRTVEEEGILDAILEDLLPNV